MVLATDVSHYRLACSSHLRPVCGVNARLVCFGCEGYAVIFCHTNSLDVTLPVDCQVLGRCQRLQVFIASHVKVVMHHVEYRPISGVVYP